VKKGSAVLQTIGAGGRLVISDFLFFIPFIAGEALRQYFVWNDIVSLVVVVIGIITYRSRKEITPLEIKSSPKNDPMPTQLKDTEKEPLLDQATKST
jgi:hypothetical protein